MNKTAVLYITNHGQRLAQRLKECASVTEIVKFSPCVVMDLWSKYEALVFIMATGIVVRTIAPLLKDKKTDPAVVVLDDAGRFVVSLAGGHLGGANDLSREIARFLGGEAVITTASDVNSLPPIDLWARDHGLAVEDWRLLPQIGTRFINNGALRVYEDQGTGSREPVAGIHLPGEFLQVSDPRFADIIITNRKTVFSGSPCDQGSETRSSDACRVTGQLYLRPGNLVVGIGCNSGTSRDEIENAVLLTLEEHNLAFPSVHSIATIDIKRDEPGLQAFIQKYNFPLRTFNSCELNQVEGIQKSDTVMRSTGAFGVAEPSALLAAGANRLLVTKQKKGNVTVAIAETKNLQSSAFGVQGQKEVESEPGTGKIFIVGTGPGSIEHITPAAREAIRKSDIIVGYGTYLHLITELLHGKEVLSTGMTQEVDRCRKAMELACSSRIVSVISGGDPGVYAMAGLVFELLRSEEGKGRTLPAVEVIPGISALNASASRLGAPLMHDFACISLSDRLTPWEVIENRIEAAAAADFVIVLYNPRSTGRPDHINRAREIILKHRQPTTVVGIVKGAMREHESVIVTDLEKMQVGDVDMQTTVIIGNSKTFVWNNLMVTPRGYENKFSI